MEESELREMFSKFGDIFQLNVLRDKATGQHRGEWHPSPLRRPNIGPAASQSSHCYAYAYQ